MIKQFLKSLTIASAAGVAIFAASSPVKAEVVNWTLDGVTFDDGGIAEGGFQYDADTNEYGDLRIDVSGGDFLDFFYESPAFDEIVSADATGFTVVDDDPFVDAFATSSLTLSFDSPLTNQGGNINLVSATSSEDELFFNDDGSIDEEFSRKRNVTAGTVIAQPVAQQVPEPFSIMGTILAGGMGITMKKKRAKKNIKSAIDC